MQTAEACSRFHHCVHANQNRCTSVFHTLVNLCEEHQSFPRWHGKTSLWAVPDLWSWCYQVRVQIKDLSFWLWDKNMWEWCRTSQMLPVCDPNVKRSPSCEERSLKTQRCFCLQPAGPDQQLLSSHLWCEFSLSSGDSVTEYLTGGTL